MNNIADDIARAYNEGFDDGQRAATNLFNGGVQEVPRKYAQPAGGSAPAVNWKDRPLPVEAREAFDRAAKAVNELAAVFDLQSAALASALRKLQRIKEFIDRSGDQEGAHRDEP